MADFAGMTVKLVLKHPPDTVLHGIVQDVIAGQTLTLRNVFCPTSGQRWETWTVQGNAIADLQVMGSHSNLNEAAEMRPQSQVVQASQTPQVAHQTTARPSQPQPTASHSFVDPAILSYTKTPATSILPGGPSKNIPSTPVKSALAKAAESLPTNGSPFIGTAAGGSKPQHNASRATAVGTSGMNGRQQELGQLGIITQDGQDDSTTKRKSRRAQKKKGQTLEPDPPPIMNVEVSRNGNDMSVSVKRGKGWRQGPFLQPSVPASPDASGYRSAGRKARENARELARNGWATEDATDIQGLDDFDFIASNKLFDKKQVFDELRQGDTTADEDRLVSHNKIARPGTHGGKNLHPTENVLSPKLGPKYHSNEADSASDADTELNFVNGRSSSRHSHSRAAVVKKQASRQNSILHDSRHAGSAAGASDRGQDRTITSVPNRGRRSSPDGDLQMSPAATSSGVRQVSSQNLSKEPRFLLKHTNTVCPVLHPVALETLEAETISRFGLTQDAITESAARSIAEEAISMFNTMNSSRRGSRNQARSEPLVRGLSLDRGASPVVVILVGNHSIAARAIAAGRHLASRRIKVIIAELLRDGASNEDPQMRAQLSMAKRMQRSGADIKRGFWQKASQYIKSLSGPPSLIIDALLGGEPYASLAQGSPSVGAAASQEAREMIDWANRSRAPVLSIGCPSGVSAVDASTSIVEGEPLAVRPDQILSLGAPVSGLYEAMKQGERWHVSVADVSVNITLRQDEAVAFDMKFVAELEWDAQ